MKLKPGVMEHVVFLFFRPEALAAVWCRLALRRSVYVLLLFAGLFAGLPAAANNVQLPGIVRVTDVTSGVATLEIDVAWDNSWRDNFNWDAVWLFLKVKPAYGAWSHVALQDITHSATGDFTVMNGKTGSSVVGVYVFRSTNHAGAASTTVTLKYSCGSYTKADFDQNRVFLLAQGVEMVYVPFGAYYLGDGRSNQTLCDAAGQNIAVNGEEALALSQRAADGVVTTAVSSLPAAYPKGYNGYYVMKYELSQEQYATFLNALTRAEQESLLTAARLSALSAGDYLFGAAGAASNRNGIILKDNSAGQPYIFANNLNGNAVYGEDGDGQCVACNYLSINDLIAYASWSGLRPMSELEYERACRAPFPQEPLPGEYVWNAVNGLSKAASLSGGGRMSELASAGSNANSGSTLAAASRGPVRCGIFATGVSTQVTAGATYWGVMEMGGNVKELVAGVANTGLSRTTNGGGTFNIGAWSTAPAHYGVRGGGFTSPDTLLRTSDRTEAAGYFSAVTTRDSTVGFRLVRALDAGSVAVNAGSIALSSPFCAPLAIVTETTAASVTPANGLPLTYVWSVKEGSGAFTVIPGETGNTLTYNVKETTAYQFKRKVVCALGEAEALSASIASLIPVRINTHPVDQLSPCTLTLKVVATGSSLTYQWQKDGADISGAKAATYTKAPSPVADAGLYRCIVRGTCGQVVSDEAVVSWLEGKLGTLTDLRDGQTYATRIMPNGHEWMIEDLKFGNCSPASFNANYKGSAVDVIASGYYGVCRASPQAGAGNLYNWQAAMNASNAVYNTAGNPSGNVEGNSPTQWQGICPPGWHLPSGGRTGEFQQMYDAVCNVVTRIYPGPDDWRGALGGSALDGSVSNAGYGFYWSSTFNSNTSAGSMRIANGDVLPSNGSYKSCGFSVRCVKNY